MRRSHTRAWRRGRLAAAAAAALLLGIAGCSGSSDNAEEGAADAPAPQGPGALPLTQPDPNIDGNFTDYGVNPEIDTAEDNKSTFALDVDTGSYSIVRSHLDQGLLPDEAAVRTEEMVNYFPQDYDAPAEGLRAHIDGTSVPFLDDSTRQVLRVGVQAAEVEPEDRQPATLTFVIDRSGSMEGRNMEMVRSALHTLVDGLDPEDEVGIVTYGDDATHELETTPASEETAIRSVIDDLRPDGSTYTEAGLRAGYEVAAENQRDDGINRVILLSDGVANVGETDPEVLADDIVSPMAEDVPLLTVGVGMDVFNDPLLEQLANQGGGFYTFVDSEHEIERLFADDLTGTLEAVATDARVQVTFDPDEVESFRLLGYENRQMEDEEFLEEDADGGHLGAGHSATALYEVAMPNVRESADAAEVAQVEVLWTDPDSGETLQDVTTLQHKDLAEAFNEAPDALQETILVGAFAEGLRGAPWGEEIAMGTVATNARRLADDQPSDRPFGEFADLVETATEL
ncbi:von Willebrand factor type A domain-containing protein [Spiractinospora alimapuensis]|uniref:vWA domain-containing protein n=1 Tax=Spiractinospora alimapuensis TaxID=2820884 RepID=UPI001F2FCF61|nr:von Willebrand factor type A domain-containing protein [Spiractinospora alimapuensis]QVQ50780.1 von Willebrand factor type A domain-containing protein [Spiractinospora alimapuensis]